MKKAVFVARGEAADPAVPAGQDSSSDEGSCPSDASPNDAQQPEKGFRDLAELRPRRAIRYTYSIRHPRTQTEVKVCRDAFLRIYGVSKTKLGTACNLAVNGPNAVVARKIMTKRTPVKYNRAKAFWWQLFDRFCQKPNEHTLLFPVNKPMKTLYAEYFQPWFLRTFPGVLSDDLPGYQTFVDARDDPSFSDVKKRPKHFHAQCGTCYRLKLRAVRCFANSYEENRWQKEMRAHDAAVRNWRGYVAQFTADARHSPHEHIVLFFDDTGSVDLPHCTNRGLKDIPTARLPVVPWLVQDYANGRDHYFYMLKNAYKKGGNRICTQLYHMLRAIKLAGNRASRAMKLTLVADNYNENKNNTLFAFLSHLVSNGWFDDIYLVFGEVGHTHNGDDAQHHIHNVIIGQYFNPTLVHWIDRYSTAWRSELTRPEPVLLHTMYDFDKYYARCIDRLAGFTRTEKDEVYVRGFHFARGTNNVVRCKISVDPAHERQTVSGRAQHRCFARVHDSGASSPPS